MPSPERINRTFYPDALVASGFTPVANVIFEHRLRLKMDSNMLLVVVALLRHIHQKRYDCIKVSFTGLCRDTGLSESTMRRTIIQAERQGVVEVSRRENCVNEYDLGPLFAKLAAVSENDATKPQPVAQQQVERSPAPEVAQPRPWIDPKLVALCKWLGAKGHLNEMIFKGFDHQVPGPLVMALGARDVPPTDLLGECVAAVGEAYGRFTGAPRPPYVAATEPPAS